MVLWYNLDMTERTTGSEPEKPSRYRLEFLLAAAYGLNHIRNNVKALALGILLHGASHVVSPGEEPVLNSGEQVEKALPLEAVQLKEHDDLKDLMKAEKFGGWETGYYPGKRFVDLMQNLKAFFNADYNKAYYYTLRGQIQEVTLPENWPYDFLPEAEQKDKKARMVDGTGKTWEAWKQEFHDTNRRQMAPPEGVVIPKNTEKPGYPFFGWTRPLGANEAEAKGTPLQLFKARLATEYSNPNYFNGAKVTLESAMATIAGEYGVPAWVLKGQGTLESSLYLAATSKKADAYGLFQFQVPTAKRAHSNLLENPSFRSGAAPVPTADNLRSDPFLQIELFCSDFNHLTQTLQPALERLNSRLRKLEPNFYMDFRIPAFMFGHVAGPGAVTGSIDRFIQMSDEEVLATIGQPPYGLDVWLAVQAHSYGEKIEPESDLRIGAQSFLYAPKVFAYASLLEDRDVTEEGFRIHPDLLAQRKEEAGTVENLAQAKAVSSEASESNHRELRRTASVWLQRLAWGLSLLGGAPIFKRLGGGAGSFLKKRWSVWKESRSKTPTEVPRVASVPKERKAWPAFPTVNLSPKRRQLLAGMLGLSLGGPLVGALHKLSDSAEASHETEQAQKKRYESNYNPSVESATVPNIERYQAVLQKAQAQLTAFYEGTLLTQRDLDYTTEEERWRTTYTRTLQKDTNFLAAELEKIFGSDLVQKIESGEMKNTDPAVEAKQQAFLQEALSSGDLVTMNLNGGYDLQGNAHPETLDVNCPYFPQQVNGPSGSINNDTENLYMRKEFVPLMHMLVALVNHQIDLFNANRTALGYPKMSEIPHISAIKISGAFRTVAQQGKLTTGQTTEKLSFHLSGHALDIAALTPTGASMVRFFDSLDNEDGTARIPAGEDLKVGQGLNEHEVIFSRMVGRALRSLEEPLKEEMGIAIQPIWEGGRQKNWHVVLKPGEARP